jgi:hypothetical protein
MGLTKGVDWVEVLAEALAATLALVKVWTTADQMAGASEKRWAVSLAVPMAVQWASPGADSLEEQMAPWSVVGWVVPWAVHWVVPWAVPWAAMWAERRVGG